LRAELLGNELFNFKRSILGATEQLYKDGFYLVAFLIFFFSIMIPVLKGVVVLWVFGFGNFVFEGEKVTKYHKEQQKSRLRSLRKV
jgi:uncharacterized paraquat-inducible protein A